MHKSSFILHPSSFILHPSSFILILAAFLQFHALAADSLWGDEIFTAIFAARPPAETIAFTAADIHPPLYYLLAGALSHTPIWPAGTPSAATDWLWRWPSAMFGVLSVAITYKLGMVLVGKRVGLIAALLLAVAPIAIKYGQEARMHAQFMMLSALATLLLALALKSNRRRYWLGYAAATILNLYTMYFAFIIIAVHGAWVFAENRSFVPSASSGQAIGHWSFGDGRRPVPSTSSGQALSLSNGSAVSGQKNSSFITIHHSSFIIWLVAIAASLLAYLPWWPVLIKLLTFRAQVGAVEGGVGSPLAFLPSVVQSLGPYGGSVWLFFLLYLAGLVAAWKRQRSLVVLGGLWVALPALLPIAMGDSRALHLRYAFVLPLYLIFVAMGLIWALHFLKQPARRWALVVAVSGLLLLSIVGAVSIYRQRKPDWRGAAKFVASQAGPKDVVAAGPLWDDQRFFSYYYPWPEQVITPPTLAFQLPGLAAEMAEVEAQLWLVTRYTPEIKRFTPHQFHGVSVMAPTQPEYDPVRLVDIGAELCKQAARSAYDWAALMETEGVLNPDPRSSQAAAWRCQGDTYAATGNFERALEPYQKMVQAFPGWAGGYAILAKTYLAVDNLPAAVDAFQLAVRYNPDWQGAIANQAAQLATEGKQREALELYQEIIE